MNTGDIILLNTYKNLKDQYEKQGIKLQHLVFLVILSSLRSKYL